MLKIYNSTPILSYGREGGLLCLIFIRLVFPSVLWHSVHLYLASDWRGVEVVHLLLATDRIGVS